MRKARSALLRKRAGNNNLQTDRLSLPCSRSDGSIRLSDLNTGNIYYSTPADTAALESTDALNRVRLKSQIILQLCNESGEVTSANSSSLAANKLISIKKDGGSIVCSYDFRDYSIKISVKYTLNKNGFSACIPMDSIECKGKLLAYAGIAVTVFCGGRRERKRLFCCAGRLRRAY